MATLYVSGFRSLESIARQQPISVRVRPALTLLNRVARQQPEVAHLYNLACNYLGK